MKPFFDTDQRIFRLQRVATSWEGTRFVPHGKIKGAGVDCVHLCAEIYRECGVFPSYSFPGYTLDGGHHLGNSVIEQWLKTSLHFEKVDKASIGTLMLFRIGKVSHHVGLIVSEQHFIHCIRGRGAALALIRDPAYSTRVDSIYCPIQIS